MLNPNFVVKFGYHTCMDWVESDKLKVAYAASFGRDVFDSSPEVKEKTRLYLSRFNSFSVREDSAVKLLKDDFHVDSVRVLDPVFLCRLDEYRLLSKNHRLDFEGDYVASYMLDPSLNKARI